MAGKVYWIAGPWPGRLAIVARPRGGDWLADEINDWRQAGIDVVVSLITQSEEAELNLQQEQNLVIAQGLQFLTFPIQDRSVPSTFWDTRVFVEQLHHLLASGKNVGLHCRQSIGRSGLIAAAVLVHAGVEIETAWARIQSARGCVVPETTEQRAWVERFAALEAMPAL